VPPGYGNMALAADLALSQPTAEFFDQKLTVAPSRNAQRSLDIEPRQSWKPHRIRRKRPRGLRQMPKPDADAAIKPHEGLSTGSPATYALIVAPAPEPRMAFSYARAQAARRNPKSSCRAGNNA
jgi:hypothetical protein